MEDIKSFVQDVMRTAILDAMKTLNGTMQSLTEKLSGDLHATIKTEIAHKLFCPHDEKQEETRIEEFIYPGEYPSTWRSVYVTNYFSIYVDGKLYKWLSKKPMPEFALRVYEMQRAEIERSCCYGNPYVPPQYSTCCKFHEFDDPRQRGRILPSHDLPKVLYKTITDVVDLCFSAGSYVHTTWLRNEELTVRCTKLENDMARIDAEHKQFLTDTGQASFKKALDKLDADRK